MRYLRWAVRANLRRPGSSALVAVALGLGIGGVTMVAATMKAVLFGALPYPDGHEIVLLAEERDGNGISVSYPNFLDWQARSRTLEGMAAYQSQNLTLPDEAGAQRLRVYRVTSDFFEVLGVPPALGRTLGGGPASGTSAGTAVISNALWVDAFGGSSDVLGRDLVLEGVVHTIVGVMPPGFDFRTGGDVWLPLEPLVPGSELESRGAHPGVYAVGRAGPDASVESIRADLNRIAVDLRSEYPEANEGVSVRMETLRAAEIGSLDRLLVLTLAAVLVLLLAACLNAASLAQSRNLERAHEMSLRLALGSGRTRLVAQLVAETLVLSGLGGVLAVGIVMAAPRLLRATSLGTIPALSNLTVDPVILGVVTVIAVAAGLAVVLLPALGVRRTTPLAATLGSARTAAGDRGARRSGGVLTGGQVALSVLLMTGAVLLGRSLLGLTRVELGFDPDDVVTFRVELPATSYEWAERPAFYTDLVERLEAIPGVVRAGVADPLPLSGRDRSQRVQVEGVPYRSAEDLERIEYAPVTAGYFDALDIELLAGRGFESSDVGDPSVAIVSRSTAERFWPDANPLGRTLTGGGPESGNPPLTVVGVVSDVRHYGARGEVPNQMYFHYPQLPLGGSVVVETTGVDPGTLAPELRAAVAAIDPGVAVYGVETMADSFADTVSNERAVTFALGLFGGVSLLLTLIGIYSVIAQGIAGRRREIAIRASLGASRPRLLGTLVGDTALPVGLGLVAGIALAVASGRLLTSFLYEVRPTDPPTLILVGLAVTAAVAVSALIPSITSLRGPLEVGRLQQ